MSDHYVLNGRDTEKVDLMTWARWFEENQDKKRVAQTDVGDVWVSTTFLGLDHLFGDGPPLLFETMIFPRKKDGEVAFQELYMDRCSTYEEAEAMMRRLASMPGPTQSWASRFPSSALSNEAPPMPMTPTGPDQRDCDECKKPIGNRPRITRSDGKVVCESCYHKPAR